LRDKDIKAGEENGGIFWIEFFRNFFTIASQFCSECHRQKKQTDIKVCWEVELRHIDGSASVQFAGYVCTL
jgi:hypothetical protein